MRGTGFSISGSVSNMVSSAGSAMSSIAAFAAKASAAHYNVLGAYTFPLGDPASVWEVGNPAGQIALTIIPIIPAMYLLALTVIPLLGNSWESIPIGFHLVLQSAFFLADPSDSKMPHDYRNPVRCIYGVPGLVLGSTAGLIPAIPYLLSSCLVHIFETTCYTSLSVGHFLIAGYDTKYDNGDRRKASWQQYVCGFLGFPLGFVFGSLYAALYWLWRLVYKNIKAGAYFFAHVTNIALFDFKDDEKIEIKNYLSPSTFIFGLPGAAIGLGLGLVSCAVVLLARIAIHSFQTAIEMMNVIIALSEEEENQKPRPPTYAERRANYLKYGFGFLGFPMGFVLGVIATFFIHPWRVIRESSISFWKDFTFLINLILPEDHPVTRSPIERATWKKWYGIPGTLLAIILSIPAMAAIFIGRIITNSFKTLPDECKKTLQHFGIGSGFTHDTSRTLIERYGFGLPGAMLGFLIGLVGGIFYKTTRWLNNNVHHAAKMVLFFMNYSLPHKHNLFHVPSITLLDSLVHFLGTGVGSIFGVLAAAVILLGRTFSNTWKVQFEIARDIVKLVLAQEDADIYGLNKQVFNEANGIIGWLGIVPGLVFGSIGATLVMLGRLMTNNAKSARFAFRYMVSLALTDDPHLLAQANAQRDCFLQFIGGVGFLLGGALGGFVYLAINAYRFLVKVAENSSKIALTIMHFMIGSVLTQQDKIKLKQKLSNIRNFEKIESYWLGALGGILSGVILGLAGTAIACIVRLISNNCKTFLGAYAHVANLTLPESLQYHSKYLNALNDTRYFMWKWIWSAPGLIVGGLVGAVVAFVAGFGHVIKHSWQTGSLIWQAVIQPFALRSDELIQSLFAESWRLLKQVHTERGWLRGYGLGFPGAILGLTLGIVTIPFLLLGHVIRQSILSGEMVFENIFYPAQDWLDGDDPACDSGSLKSQNRTVRDYFKKYIVGFPGVLLSFALSMIAVGLYAVGRFVYETYQSYSTLSTWIDNFIYDDVIAYPSVPRSMIRQFLGGLLGCPLAIVHGIISASVQTLKNTLPSFLYLSGALINVGRDSNIFDTLDADTRAAKQKAFGIFGYALALAISGPLALMIFGGRVLTNATLFAFAIIMSPVILFFKILGTCCSSDNTLTSHFRKLAQLYANRDAWGMLIDVSGNLEEPTHINTYFDDTWSRFAVKCFTLNALSLHEAVLEIFGTTRDGDQQAIDLKIEELKQEGINWWMTEQEKNELHADIDSTRKYIENYLCNSSEVDDQSVPVVLSHPSPTLVSLFWGDKKEKSQNDSFSTPPLLV